MVVAWGVIMGFTWGVKSNVTDQTTCAVYRFKHTKGTQPNLKIHNSKVIHASKKTRNGSYYSFFLRSKMMAVSRTCQPTCPTDVECCCRGGGIDFDFLSTSFDAFQIDTTIICASTFKRKIKKRGSCYTQEWKMYSRWLPRRWRQNCCWLQLRCMRIFLLGKNATTEWIDPETLATWGFHLSTQSIINVLFILFFEIFWKKEFVFFKYVL